MKFHISEIFYSINGEVSPHGQGSPCVFIRFDGCNLRCSYCDTPHTQGSPKGTEMTFDQIMKEVEKYNCKNITVTGGEPFYQNNIYLFLTLLDRENYSISVETNGSYFIPRMNRGWNVVLDYKLEQEESIIDLKEHYFIEGDWIKFVVSSEEQAEIIVPFLNTIYVDDVHMAISVIHENPKKLINIILEKSKDFPGERFVFNFQLHKFLKLK